MTWFDLATGNLLRRGVVGHVLPGAAPLTGVTTADITRLAGAALAIRFDKFSDGRGFTAARHVREVLGFDGPLVAQGHIIPDQADYLRRCGFTHAEINLRAAQQWRRSLALAPPAMQRVLGSPRARSLIPNRRHAPPKRQP
ncbi:MAG: DUF934 domain-containing protein [SAR116 cluster bacterium]|jgi:uncharacterized protein (DUF934 family)|nr:MAG: DUF934 domain-containing protein [SAR116 cluster bacterium]|tara:strand:- start:1171 stop:1593 length:423 start_codon:yes stop_codon:yes gene_type:complete